MKKGIIMKLILILFLIILFIYLCFSDNGLIDFLKDPSRIDIGWILMAFFCQVINIILDSVLIYFFIHSIDKKVKFRNAISCGLIGQFFCAVTPGSSGGQPMQVYVMSKKNIDTGTTTAALIQKFVVYQTTLIVFCIGSIFLRIDYFNNLNPIAYSVLILGFLVQSCVALVLWLVSFNQKLTSKIISFAIFLLAKLKIIKDPNKQKEFAKVQLELFHAGNSDLYKNKALLLKTYVVTAIQLTSMCIIPYCIYRSFGFYDQRPSDLVSAQIFIYMVSSFFPVPGASGATEGASSFFLKPFFDETSIKSAIVLTRLITYYLTIIISAPSSLLWKKRKSKQ